MVRGNEKSQNHCIFALFSMLRGNEKSQNHCIFALFSMVRGNEKSQNHCIFALFSMVRGNEKSQNHFIFTMFSRVLRHEKSPNHCKTQGFEGENGSDLPTPPSVSPPGSIGKFESGGLGLLQKGASSSYFWAQNVSNVVHSVPFL